MEMGTIRTKVSRSHSEIIAFLSLTFCSPKPSYNTNTYTTMVATANTDWTATGLMHKTDRSYACGVL